MIKNIIFDMGNVLLDYNPRIPLGMYLDNDSDRTLIRKELFESEEWILRDKGMITKDEMYHRIVQRIPDREDLKNGLRKCIDNWYVCMKALPGARECVESCKKAGYKVYILSNAGDDFHEYFKEFLPEEYFDGIIVSAFIHKIKPEPEIYQHLLNQYHLKAEECFFVDDRQDNVEAAVAAGMYGMRFEGSYDAVCKAVFHL